MTTSSRRMFLQVMGLSGVYVTVAACRVKNDGSAVLADPVMPEADDPDVIMVTLQDILTEGHSTLGSGFLGFNGPLKAQLIKDNKTVTMPYVQDPHGHKFTLTPDHFAKLRRGETVDVTTTIALGHRHIVRINPARKIASSAPITMPVDIPNGDLPAEPAEPAAEPGLPSLSNATFEPG